MKDEIHDINIRIAPLQMEINLEIRITGKKEVMTVEIMRQNEMILYRPNIDIGIRKE